METLNAALASDWLAVADSAMISSSEVLGLSGVAVSAIDAEMVRLPGWVAAFWILGVMLFLGRIVLGHAPCQFILNKNNGLQLIKISDL